MKQSDLNHMLYYTAQAGALKASAVASASYPKVNRDNTDTVPVGSKHMWVTAQLLTRTLNPGNVSRITKEITMQVRGNPSGNNNITYPLIADRPR